MNLHNIYLIAICLFLTRAAKAQESLETFIAGIHRFACANYTGKDFLRLKAWSDSSYVQNDNKKHIKQVWFRGNMISKEGAQIEFTFAGYNLKTTGEKKAWGSILFSHRRDCDVLLQPVLGYLAQNSFSYDTLQIKDGFTCTYDKIYLVFNNYSPSTNKVLQDIDTSLTRLLKHEYFDFYFGDINRATSTWQKEFRTFMQPNSDVLIALLKKNNIPGIFRLIALPNKNYSWFLAEGLWYYNSLHPCLTPEQTKTVEAFNGKDGMISFRPSEELREVYKF
ncbi:MAG: hypothetical protein BGO55_11445 [Sphingobacteriales bacterium 50-39]|nr:hypothetical protein [Sphingobacteriales bacterium]OJW54308.1 MAG: hypothetical protein BGO55_11445 [Sphingobacteriales bacterium 50-39]